jgi:Tol biopolymer transport system component
MVAAAGLCVAGSAVERALAASPERILFSSNRADPDKFNVYSVSPTGGTPKQLTKTEAREFDPLLSPDGTKIACSVLENPQMPLTDIYVMDVDGKNRKRLTDGTVLAFEPQWSPDGKRLAFTAIAPNAGGAQHPTIVLVDADGKNPHRLTEGMFPSWSPDGKRLLITNLDTANGMTEPHLYTVNADGSEEKRLGDAGGVMGQWSPDGKQIVFMGDGGNNQPDLWVMSADGTGKKQVTKTEDIEIGPSWSADGKRIYFTRTSKLPQNPPKAKIMAIDADGKNEKSLTGGEALDMTGGAFLFMGRARLQQNGAGGK